MTKGRKVIFLDFDGVLHPNFSTREDSFCLAGAFLAALDRAPVRTELVISSSWRFQHSIDELLAFLPKSLAARVIGFTPEVEPGRFQRYREIRTYLQCYANQPDWRAVDDDRLSFPNPCAELILCDSRRGFDAEVEVILGRWLGMGIE